MRKIKKYSLVAALIGALVFTNIMVANAIPVDEQLINQNRSYKNLQPIGITIHDTCDSGGTAQNNRDYFNRIYVGSSAHFFVDWKGVIQTIPKDEVAWHAGPYANYRYLSIEMCNPAGFNQEQFNEVYKNTVSLAVDLCISYGWSASDIVSHKFISDTYHQTDHEDPDAFLQRYGKSWDMLISDITATLNAVKGLNSNKGYIVTNYIKPAYSGYDGVNVEEIINKHFRGITYYIRRDSNGIWIETQYLDRSKCEELKQNLGSLFYSISY